MPKIVHCELPFDDAQRANKFYAEVFGWNSSKWDGPEEYYLQQTGGRRRALRHRRGAHRAAICPQRRRNVGSHRRGRPRRLRRKSGGCELRNRHATHGDSPAWAGSSTSVTRRATLWACSWTTTTRREPNAGSHRHTDRTDRRVLPAQPRAPAGAVSVRSYATISRRKATWTCSWSSSRAMLQGLYSSRCAAN